MLSEVLATDTETPVSLFLRLRQGAVCSALFESVAGSERWARQSLIAIGAQPATELRRLSDLKAIIASLPSTAASPLDGCFGHLSYESASWFEKVPNLSGEGAVLGELFFADTVLLFDHIRHRVQAFYRHPAERDRVHAVLSHDHGERVNEVSAVAVDVWNQVHRKRTDADYAALVRRAKEYIAAGDAFQIVLSQRFVSPRRRDGDSRDLDLFETYRALRQQNPSPYLFYMKTPGREAAGASPETMLRVENDTVTVRPLAGTRPRGADEAADVQLSAELLADDKERAEHVMLIDLGRNDVGRVSEPGSVVVDPLMVVERYSHVMHLVSEVRGKLRSDCTVLDAIASAFPAGTLSGAPKRRAMEIIAELEGEPRGLYGGAVGYIASQRACDFAIAIRTAFAEGDKVVVQAGAGIVFDSDEVKENQECLNKARSPLLALATANVRRRREARGSL